MVLRQGGWLDVFLHKSVVSLLHPESGPDHYQYKECQHLTVWYRGQGLGVARKLPLQFSSWFGYVQQESWFDVFLFEFSLTLTTLTSTRSANTSQSQAGVRAGVRCG